METRMSKHNIVFIGMDTHKSFIEVAYIENVRDVKPIKIGNNPDIKQLVTKLNPICSDENP